MTHQIRERLVAFITTTLQARHASCNLTDDLSLIRSGLLDSVELVALVQWIEREVGPECDASLLESLENWDSIAEIVRFIADRGQAGGSGT